MLSKEEKIEIYDAIMEAVQPIFKKFLNELSFETVQRAQKAVAARNLSLVDDKTSKTTSSSMGAGWKIDTDKFKKYLSQIENPKRRERLIRLYKEGKLEKYFIRQQNCFSTIGETLQ